MDLDFIQTVPHDERHKVEGLLSLIAVEQLHKPSTPVRPVLDYRWLNKLIHSNPNEGLETPVSAPMCLRRWRAHKQGTMCLIDIKKAYLQIFVHPDQTWFQCLRYPSEADVFRLTRLGFGLSISPKVLRVVLSEILPSDAFPSIDTYIDDNFLPVEDASLVRDKLREHGFETKEPEPVNRSRVLGLQNSPDGTWTRRGDTPRLERHTKRGVHSWTGKLVCHLPIARWLRPCVSALKRLCAVQDWDEPLNDHAVKACQRLTKWLEDRGDPCAGQWSYEPSDPWTLYTDASCTAYGAVLMVGNVYVEDQTYLRAPGDRRHINLAELIAVHKGIHLVSLYRKALRITESTTINLKCDNKSVVAWLTRAQERHWTSIKGMSAKVIEKHLLAISDDCQALGIKLKVDLIPSEENISDPLSRVPDVLRGPDQPFDPKPIQDVICMTQAGMPVSSFERDEYNRWKVDKETLVTLMLTMHEHEGAQTLYDRLRALVSFKDLRRQCQQFVRDCATCNLSKVTAHTAVLRGDAHMPQTFVPFSHVHMDISGPYGSVDNIDKAYVISLIDRHSRYVLTRATSNAPTASDCSGLLRTTFERFHVCVDFVYTDEGSQFVSAEFTRTATDLGCSVSTTPVHSSWANGRVERWHRILNDYLRSHLGDGLPTASFRLFDAAVGRATLLHNTTRSSRTGESPHELVFTFPAWIYPTLKQYRPPLVQFEDVPHRLEALDHPRSDRRLPQVGEIWLYRVPTGRKLSRPYEPCRIVGRLSTQVYLIRFRSRAVKKVHLRHLKSLTPAAAAQLPELPAPIPADDRPLRDLKGGGGHVVDTSH